MRHASSDRQGGSAPRADLLRSRRPRPEAGRKESSAAPHVTDSDCICLPLAVRLATLLGVAAAPPPRTPPALGPVDIDGVDSIALRQRPRRGQPAQRSASAPERHRLLRRPRRARSTAAGPPASSLRATRPAATRAARPRPRASRSATATTAPNVGVDLDARPHRRRRRRRHADRRRRRRAAATAATATTSSTAGGGADLLSGQDGSDSVLLRQPHRTGRPSISPPSRSARRASRMSATPSPPTSSPSSAAPATTRSPATRRQPARRRRRRRRDRARAPATTCSRGGAGNDSDRRQLRQRFRRRRRRQRPPHRRHRLGRRPRRRRRRFRFTAATATSTASTAAPTPTRSTRTPSDTVAECEVGAPSVAAPADLPARPAVGLQPRSTACSRCRRRPSRLKGGHVTLERQLPGRARPPAAAPASSRSSAVARKAKGKGKAKARSSRRTRRFSARREVLRRPRRQEGQGPRPHLDRRSPRDQPHRHGAAEGPPAPHQARQALHPHRDPEGAGVAPHEARAPAREEHVLIRRCAGAPHSR